MNTDYLAVLTRFDYQKEQTLGDLSILHKGEEIFTCKCLELPWRDNERSVSCIPEGQYDVRKRKAHESGSRTYDHFLVKDVPNRSYILWHSGNYNWDVQGCLLMGKSHTDINGDGLRDVTSSRATIAKLNDILPDEFDFLVTATLEAKRQII